MEQDEKMVDEKEIKTTKKPKKNKTELKIEELTLEVSELNDKYLRTLAETENFKKRIQAEKFNDRKYAATSFAHELLVPFEQLDKIVEIPTENELLKNYLIGFKMIRDQFKNILEQEGVKEIKALGEPFDFKIHHAVEKAHDKSKADGEVIEVLQKGYYFKDRVLRPSMVKVNEWSEENGEDK